jgi:hypothetical protein
MAEGSLRSADVEAISDPGGFADWAAFTRLTFDYLRDHAGHVEVELKRRNPAGERRVMMLREFLDYCETSNETLPFYLTE